MCIMGRMCGHLMQFVFNFVFGFFSSTVEEKRRKVQQTGADSEQEKRCSRVLRELCVCLINSLSFFLPILPLSLSLSSSHPSPPPTIPLPFSLGSEPSSRAVTPAPPGSDVGSEVSSEAGGECRDDGRIVPQLRVGKDGNIILDEGR